MTAFTPISQTVSHWQATNRGPSSLYGHNTSAPVPGEADIVIVGGGTMGAALAYFLTREGAEGEGKRVVVLEARDVGSGASGRNGVCLLSGYFTPFQFTCADALHRDTSDHRPPAHTTCTNNPSAAAGPAYRNTRPSSSPNPSSIILISSHES